MNRRQFLIGTGATVFGIASVPWWMSMASGEVHSNESIRPWPLEYSVRYHERAQSGSYSTRVPRPTDELLGSFIEENKYNHQLTEEVKLFMSSGVKTWTNVISKETGYQALLRSRYEFIHRIAPESLVVVTAILNGHLDSSLT